MLGQVQPDRLVAGRRESTLQQPDARAHGNAPSGSSRARRSQSRRGQVRPRVVPQGAQAAHQRPDGADAQTRLDEAGARRLAPRRRVGEQRGQALHERAARRSTRVQPASCAARPVSAFTWPKNPMVAGRGPGSAATAASTADGGRRVLSRSMSSSRAPSRQTPQRLVRGARRAPRCPCPAPPRGCARGTSGRRRARPLRRAWGTLASRLTRPSAREND